MAAHPFLEPVDPDFGEQLSDADSANSGAIEMGDGSMRYVAPGSIPDQLGIKTELHAPLSKAGSEYLAARSNVRQ